MVWWLCTVNIKVKLGYQILKSLAVVAQSRYRCAMSKNKFPPRKKQYVRDIDDGPFYLYGIHTVRAALDNPLRKKHRLVATTNALNRLTESNPIGNVPVTEASPRDFDELVGKDTVHQGAALEVESVTRASFDDIPDLKLVVVLDQITDPHNVGAILRTACAFGADAIITTSRYAPRETGVMAKAASGALDMVPLIEVRNLADALKKLKDRGLSCLGFDSEAETNLKPRTDGQAIAIVLGAEGKGLRQRTRELCDEVVKLDMPGPIKSLNVSNAAAIALFAVTGK